MKGQSSHAVSLDVCAPVIVLGQEGQWTLKVEEQVTRLFDALRGPVYRYLLCLGVDSAHADEIVQETFFRLYRHLHAGGREDNLRGWIFRVAHNISINELKRRKHIVPSAPEQWAEFSVSSIDPAPDPEELLLRKERILRAYTAISTLSGQQKQCLYLRAEGFRYREIAEMLGVTVSTVAESLRRAIKKLIGDSNG
jgi:RNA polymerase sigma-70 factor (ECF subfamily)